LQQGINGFSKAEYDSEVDLYGLTLKQAIATTMQDMNLVVTNLVVTAEGAARSVRRARALQTSSTVSLAYTVNGVSRYAAASIAAQLEAGLVSGAFDTALYLLAVQNNATGLVNATSDSAKIYLEDEDNADNETLSGGAIAGIVIGIVAFSAIVGVLTWYFATKRVPSE